MTKVTILNMKTDEEEEEDEQTTIVLTQENLSNSEHGSTDDNSAFKENLPNDQNTDLLKAELIKEKTEHDGCEACSNSNPKDETESLMVQYFKKIPYSGIVLTILASVIFTGVSSIVKVLEEVSPFYVASYRNAVTLCLSVPFVFLNKSRLLPKGKRESIALTGRAIFSGINVGLMYYVFRHLPLGDARVISSTSPIFVALFAFVFLRERFGLFEMVNICVALVGIVIVMQPPMFFGSSDYQDDEDKSFAHFETTCFAFVATIFASLSITGLRALKNMDPCVVTAWNCIAGTIVPFIMGLIMGESQPNVPKSNAFLLIVLAGALSLIGQVFGAYAMKTDRAAKISLTRKSADIMAAYIVQMAFFNEYPTGLTVFGAIIVVCSVLHSPIRKIADEKSESICIRLLCCLPPLQVKEAIEDH